jgi:hypothetical protein
MNHQDGTTRLDPRSSEMLLLPLRLLHPLSDYHWEQAAVSYQGPSSAVPRSCERAETYPMRHKGTTMSLCAKVVSSWGCC